VGERVSRVAELGQEPGCLGDNSAGFVEQEFRLVTVAGTAHQHIAVAAQTRPPRDRVACPRRRDWTGVLGSGNRRSPGGQLPDDLAFFSGCEGEDLGPLSSSAITQDRLDLGGGWGAADEDEQPQVTARVDGPIERIRLASAGEWPNARSSEVAALGEQRCSVVAVARRAPVELERRGIDVTKRQVDMESEDGFQTSRLSRCCDHSTGDDLKAGGRLSVGGKWGCDVESLKGILRERAVAGLVRRGAEKEVAERD